MQEREKKEQLYTQKNPPPSLEAAMARLTELDAKIAGIEAQLEHKDEKLHSTTYVSWLKSATGALGWAKAERKFVAHWIEDHTNPSKLRERKMTELTAFVEERVVYFNSMFHDRYGGHLPAPPIDEVPAILLVLGQLASECQTALIEYNERSTQLNLSKNEHAKMCKPLGAINYAILQAISHLKSRLSPTRRFDRVGFLIALVKRAIVEGLTLTEEESATYEKILAERSAANEPART